MKIIKIKKQKKLSVVDQSMFDLNFKSDESNVDPVDKAFKAVNVPKLNL